MNKPMKSIKIALITFCLFHALPVMANQNPSVCFGKVVSKSGNIVRIKLDNPPQITSGKNVDVYKYFQKKIFGMNTTGWLHAAEAKIIAINGNNIKIKIIREKSVMTVNKKKVEHLKSGVKVKLILK